MHDEKLDCPLLRKQIATGMCVDINLERNGIMIHDALKDVLKNYRLTLAVVNSTCDACNYCPRIDESVR
jgi:hypothetical protein